MEWFLQNMEMFGHVEDMMTCDKVSIYFTWKYKQYSCPSSICRDAERRREWIGADAYAQAELMLTSRMPMTIWPKANSKSCTSSVRQIIESPAFSVLFKFNYPFRYVPWEMENPQAFIFKPQPLAIAYVRVRLGATTFFVYVFVDARVLKKKYKYK